MFSFVQSGDPLACLSDAIAIFSSRCLPPTRQAQASQEWQRLLGQCRTRMASGIAEVTSSGRHLTLGKENAPVTIFYAIWLYAPVFIEVFTEVPCEIRV